MTRHAFGWWDDAVEFAIRQAKRTGAKQRVRLHCGMWAVERA